MLCKKCKPDAGLTILGLQNALDRILNVGNGEDTHGNSSIARFYIAWAKCSRSRYPVI